MDPDFLNVTEETNVSEVLYKEADARAPERTAKVAH